MDVLSFLPFRDEMLKIYHGLTSNATHTSDKPLFAELKVRRYATPASEVAEIIIDKIERWTGWSLKNEKTAVGGMKTIRAEVSSFALLGMKIDVTFGLLEETDANGRKITTVNAKAHTRIDSRGDLGESRHMLRMLLASLDFELRPQILTEDEYLLRSLDPKNSSGAFQQLFDETKLEHRPSNPKATAIEFKKPAKQTIELKKPVAKKQVIEFKSSRNGTEAAEPVSAPQNGATVDSPTAPSQEDPKKPSRPKITVVSLKKNS
ncbi:MAG TPA: hypothetical protein ENL07_01275 [Chlorobaculum parvum]|uniref:Uncharacterized protein n=1 Tax=Chlorobaculum parvum TaxID=274539 RepID=A0A7C5DCZ8_9CHLB|nr:hypothetical protein [Chlorobaculum parvum]